MHRGLKLTSEPTLIENSSSLHLQEDRKKLSWLRLNRAQEDGVSCLFV